MIVQATSELCSKAKALNPSTGIIDARNPWFTTPNKPSCCQAQVFSKCSKEFLAEFAQETQQRLCFHGSNLPLGLKGLEKAFGFGWLVGWLVFGQGGWTLDSESHRRDVAVSSGWVFDCVWSMFTVHHYLMAIVNCWFSVLCFFWLLGDLRTRTNNCRPNWSFGILEKANPSPFLQSQDVGFTYFCCPFSIRLVCIIGVAFTSFFPRKVFKLRMESAADGLVLLMSGVAERVSDAEENEKATKRRSGPHWVLPFHGGIPRGKRSKNTIPQDWVKKGKRPTRSYYWIDGNWWWRC